MGDGGKPVFPEGEQLKSIVLGARTVAVVGLSADPARQSHQIASYLQKAGYRIVGVNPAHTELLGEPCYPSLSEMPAEARETVDLIVVFRRPEAVIALLEEATRLGFQRLWLQPGASSQEVIEEAQRLGVELIVEQCIRVVHTLYSPAGGKSG